MRRLVVVIVFLGLFGVIATLIAVKDGQDQLFEVPNMVKEWSANYVLIVDKASRMNYDTDILIDWNGGVFYCLQKCGRLTGKSDLGFVKFTKHEFDSHAQKILSSPFVLPVREPPAHSLGMFFLDEAGDELEFIGIDPGTPGYREWIEEVITAANSKQCVNAIPAIFVEGTFYKERNIIYSLDKLTDEIDCGPCDINNKNL